MPTHALPVPPGEYGSYCSSLMAPLTWPFAHCSLRVERFTMPHQRFHSRRAGDMRGAIMDRASMIQKLNEILKWEYAGLVQYTQFSFVVQDTWREVFSKFFRENGEEALEHAHVVGDKIVALGGVPTVERGEVKQST